MNKAFVIIMIFSVCFLHANPPFDTTISDNVKLFDQLTLDEKIGQLFIVATVSDPAINEAFLKTCPYNTDHDHIKDLIKNHHIGGIIFLGASEPTKQVATTKELHNYNEAYNKIKLFIAQDCE